MRHTLLLAATAIFTSSFIASAELDFAREVLPILSNKCFACHGPDAKKKELRLDSYEGATKDLGDYQAINPKNLADSEIIHRIFDKDDPMPPEKAHEKLTDKERAILKQWVLEGGTYAQHWAFVPPVKHDPPKIKTKRGFLGLGKKQTVAPIDAFVGKRLQDSGSDFAPEADKTTLARRAAFTLTGLPPEPEELATFLSDKSKDAYERYVDGLLARPGYGEHQARYWLDAVRYGDTHGLHLDNKRGIFPYRDWVVRAFNENQPFDEFITWQLAGDLLPSPTMAQQVATGYVRMNPTTAEGGVIPAEFQAKNNFDRTENFGTVFLGMTMICARCHTHKYDPITHQEYFELFAFFNSTAESPLDGNKYEYGPVMRVPAGQADWAKWHQLQPQRDKILKAADAAAKEKHEALLAYADPRASVKTENWKISKARKDKKKSENPKDWSAVKGLPGVSKERLSRNSGQQRWVTFDLSVAVETNYVMRFKSGKGAKAFIGDRELTAIGRTSGDEWSYSLSLSTGKYAISTLVTASSQHIPVGITVKNAWQALAKHKNWSKCSPEDRLAMLGDPKGPLANVEGADVAGSLASQLSQMQARFTTTLVARELGKPRETKLLDRGEYAMPTGDPLKPNTLSIMGTLPDDLPRNRLGLAKWLTADDHPLTTRVLINQVWQRVFGEGLVRTPEDFGLQGQHPTHPELLDWLALEFRDSGWNLKHMLKLMVTSRTYKQSSAHRKDVTDPENKLFARGPRHRLSAEELRDVALWASGLLQSEMGGAGVKPYQPEGMWKILSHPASNTKQYVPDTGDKVFRRSLYVYWKRTSPHPMMTLFDAPSREVSCVRRSRSNTPLQSLGLFNEPQRVEVARHFAARLLTERDTDGARLDHAFELIASRQPTTTERKVCENLLTQMRTRYASAPEAAKALAGKSDVNPVEHAAWTQLTTTLLASDLAINLY
jgi:hypothetical protein